MAKPNTHFDQVPLEAIKKIVEEQAPEATTTKPDLLTRKKKLEKELLAAQDQAKARLRMSSGRE
jgi:hypothetical protein